MAMVKYQAGRYIAHTGNGKSALTIKALSEDQTSESCAYYPLQGFSIANVAAVALAVQFGLGKRADGVTTDQQNQAKQALIASFAVTFVTEGLSAISFVCLLRSMNPQKRYKQFLIGLCAAIAAWTLAGIIRFAVTVSPTVPDPDVNS